MRMIACIALNFTQDPGACRIACVAYALGSKFGEYGTTCRL